MQHEQLLRDGLGSFGVEVNIVEDRTLVPMEIQVPDRFKEKNINSNERWVNDETKSKYKRA